MTLAPFMLGISLLESSVQQHILPLRCKQIGGRVVDGCLEIDRDDPSNFKQVKGSVHILLRACGCKKGCTTIRCSCIKVGTKCGPGCKCTDFQSTPSARSQSSEPDNDVELQELQDDQSVRQAYSMELVDDMNDGGAESDNEQDEDILTSFEPEDDN